MKTILVTGTSTGIGWDTVRVLSESNHRVIATVRSEVDVARLKKNFPKSVIPIILDLTQIDQIAKLPEYLKKEYKINKLDGLVNNAGIALAGPILDQDFSEIESTLRINVLAVIKITQVLLPLLGAYEGSSNPGTIINISSISGRSGVPFLGAYVASKHAIEGFSDVLRKEMMLFGIKVVVIGPGSIKTPIWEKGFELFRNKYSNSIYNESFQKFVLFAMNESAKALEVSEVSELIARIFKTKTPRFRYAPIPRTIYNRFLPLLLPARFYNFLTARVLGIRPKIRPDN